jgi:hypothetical protein
LPWSCVIQDLANRSFTYRCLNQLHDMPHPTGATWLITLPEGGGAKSTVCVKLQSWGRLVWTSPLKKYNAVPHPRLNFFVFATLLLSSQRNYSEVEKIFGGWICPPCTTKLRLRPSHLITRN